MATRITVPPEGTCAGKATLVDASGDPIGYHLSEALRLIVEQRPESLARDFVSDALNSWGLDLAEEG